MFKISFSVGLKNDALFLLLIFRQFLTLHMQKSTQIDLLAKELMQRPTEAGLELLWREVFQLPHWYFLARKVSPTVEPYFALIDNKAWLTIFTDPDRLYNFASLQGIVQFPGQEIDVFSMDSVKGFAYALHYLKTDIHGVWFDLPEGFNIPLDTLKDIGLYLGVKYIGTEPGIIPGIV